MRSLALASIAYEIGQDIGDTSSTFLSRISGYLNNRYSDLMFRTCVTVWTMASLSDLGASSIPTVGTGEVIRAGATADAWDAKRQFNKSAKYENKYEFMLRNFIISQPVSQFGPTFSRYGYID